MGANAHISYAQRKNNREPIIPIHPELKEDLDEILAPTYHLIVYQEQIMSIARKLAGYTLGGADLLRRAMGKKKRSTSWRKTSSPSRRVCVNTVTPTMPSRLCGTSWSPSLDTPLTNPTLLAMDLSRIGRLTSRPTTRLNTALLC
ncbi:DNA polymerase III alpha subunit [Cutibacterium acnes JCM 18916]|nr:DNA polymerase III alpha subunit [Cutibacterium acnes JCM 18916]